MATNPPRESAHTLQDQMVLESCSMIRHLVAKGTRVPVSLVQAAAQFEAANKAAQPVDLPRVAAVHAQLARLVAPASPGTVYLLDDAYHRPTWFASFGPVPLVRNIIWFAITSVVAFMLISVHEVVDASAVGTQKPYMDALIESVHLLAAAAVGASFAILFQLSESITSRTYDPDEAASHVLKLFLGVVAGFIIVAMVPVPDVAAGNADAGAVLTKPTIALLGGFSASAVYRILSRLVETLENLFSGSPREQSVAREQAASARVQDEAAQARLSVAGKLMQVQQQLAAGTAPDSAARQLQQVIDGLVPATASDLAADAPSTAESSDAAPVSASGSSAGSPSSGDAAPPSGATPPPSAAPSAQPVTASGDTPPSTDAPPADAIIATPIPAAPLTVEVTDDVPASPSTDSAKS